MCLQKYQQESCPDIIVNSNTKSTKRTTKKHPKFNTFSYLKAICGVCIAAIYGIIDIIALEILSKTRTDMSKWQTHKHFVSWLNLCPNNKISGGKLISSMLKKKKPNVASQAFRNAVNTVHEVTIG